METNTNITDEVHGRPIDEEYLQRMQLLSHLKGGLPVDIDENLLYTTKEQKMENLKMQTLASLESKDAKLTAYTKLILEVLEESIVTKHESLKNIIKNTNLLLIHIQLNLERSKQKMASSGLNYIDIYSLADANRNMDEYLQAFDSDFTDVKLIIDVLESIDATFVDETEQRNHANMVLQAFIACIQFNCIDLTELLYPRVEKQFDLKDVVDYAVGFHAYKILSWLVEKHNQLNEIISHAIYKHDIHVLEWVKDKYGKFDAGHLDEVRFDDVRTTLLLLNNLKKLFK